MPTAIDRKFRRIVYWTWPIVMLIVGLALGALLEYNHINSVVDDYAKDSAKANCAQQVLTRREGRVRADATITLKKAMIQFSSDAAKRRAQSKLPADQQTAAKYLAVNKKVKAIKITKLPLIRCVNGKATPILPKGKR